MRWTLAACRAVEYGLTGLPTTYWLDGRGRIVARQGGKISGRQLEDGIEAALKMK